MVAETRSQRQAYQHHYNQQQPAFSHTPYPQRPQYPQSTAPTTPQSAPSSVFQSSSSLASLSLQTQQSPNNMSSTSQDDSHMFASAPLPSPSGSQSTSYFGSLAQAQNAPTLSSSHSIQQDRGQQSHQQASGAYMGQRGGAGGGLPETAPFLKDFNLVAEAAKRAQMACLARDLGEFGM